MRDLRGRRSRGKGARAWKSTIALGVLAVGLALVPSTADAKTFPCPTTPHEPCKGPIEVVTNYSGYKEGPLSQIKLTLGPSRRVGGETHEQFLTKPEIYRRTVSWHSVPDVEVVAVFVLHRPKGGQFIYQPIPTGKHSGHTTLTDVKKFPNAEPVLIVQGRRIAASSSAHSAKAHCYVVGVPCLGSLESLYAFTGKAGGATSSLHASLSPEEPAGTDSDGHQLVKRTFHWHTATGIKLVAAYEIIAYDDHGKGRWHIHRLPTGPHSGRATFTMATEPNHLPVRDEVPLLLLEGERS